MRVCTTALGSADYVKNIIPGLSIEVHDMYCHEVFLSHKDILNRFSPALLKNDLPKLAILIDLLRWLYVGRFMNRL